MPFIHKALTLLVLITTLAAPLLPATSVSAAEPVGQSSPTAPVAAEQAATPAPAASVSATSAPALPIACTLLERFELYLPLMLKQGSSSGGPNQPPLARSCRADVPADTAVQIELAPFSADPDSNTLTWTLALEPQHGTAAIISSTLFYTPTASFTGSDDLRYTLSDGLANTAARVELNVQGGPLNHAPVANDTVVTVIATNTMQLDLGTLASDADLDPLTYTLLTQPTTGTTVLAGSTLWYTPTTPLTDSQQVEYSVSDGRGGSDSGIVLLSPKPTRIHVTPGGITLGGAGQSHTFSAKAYDALGNEVDPATLDLEWVTTEPLSVSIAPSADGASAVITSQVDLGTIPVIVRSRSDANVYSALVMVTVATIKPEVQVLHNAQIVYPVGNPIPNRDNSFPIDDQGNTIVGAFTGDEVVDVYDVTLPDESDGVLRGPDLSYPVVLQGVAPAVGQLIVADESAPVMGKVTQIVAEREGYVLLKVEQTSFDDIFSALAFSFDSIAMIESGLLRPEQFISTEPVSVSNGLVQNREPAPPGLFADGPCEVGAGFLGLEGKLATSLNFVPPIRADLVIGERDDGSSFLSWFKIMVGAGLTGDIDLGVKLQPGVQVSVACNIMKSFTVGLPPGGGIIDLIDMLIGPQIEFTPKIEAAIKIQGLLTWATGYNIHFEALAEGGYEYRDPDGFHGQGQWLKNVKKDGSAKPTSNTLTYDELSPTNAKIEFSVQAVLVADAEFQLGKRLFDILSYVPGLRSRIDAIKEKLNLKVLSFKTGPQLKTEWGTPAFVVAEQGGFAPSSNLNWIATGEFGITGMIKALEKFKIYASAADIKLFDFGASILIKAFYLPLSGATINVDSSAGLKPGQPLTITVTPQVQVPNDVTDEGQIFFKGSSIAQLERRSDNTLRAILPITQEFCDRAEAEPNNKARLDFVVFNRMPNNISFFPTALMMGTPNFVGSTEVSCKEFNLNLTTTPDVNTLKAQTIDICRDGVSSTPQPYKIPYHLSAHDDWGRIDSLKLSVVKSDGSVVIGSQEKANQPPGPDIRFDGTLIFQPEQDDSVAEYTLTARAHSPASGDQAERERVTTFPIKLRWKDCSGDDLTLNTAVTAKRTASGTYFACLNRGETAVSINSRAMANNSTGIEDLEVTAEYNGLVETATQSGAGTATNLATTLFFQINKDAALALDQPLEIQITAKVRYRNADGEIESATKEETVYVQWVNCEDVKVIDNRTRENDCFILHESRSRTDHVYKNAVTGAEILREEGAPDEWTIYSAEPKSNENCGRRIRRSGGDPHLNTPDGYQYDNFALGEFVYLTPKSGDAGLQIQARQQRVNRIGNFELFPWTSWITALAVRADGTTFEFMPQISLAAFSYTLRINGQPTLLEPGLHRYGAVDLTITPDHQAQLSYAGSVVAVHNVLNAFLEISVDVAPDGMLHGMLGTPDGDSTNDLVHPDGTPAIDTFDMADAWRITEREQSLFTYEEGQGPETFNQDQLGEPPSLQELAPYLDDAQILLQVACDESNIDPIVVRNTALELLTGRDPLEILQTGLCWFVVGGHVHNALVPGLPVPGAKVTLSVPNQPDCVTYTDREGAYRCAIPSLGVVPTVEISVSGRGSASDTRTFSALPLMGGTLEQTADLEVEPTTIQINGHVQDASSAPLVNAQVRFSGPAAAGFSSGYAEAGGDGAFTAYQMFDDGVLSGDNRYELYYVPSWSTNPRAQGIARTVVQTLPTLSEHSLNVITPTLEMSGSSVHFSGRVSYAQHTEQGVAHVPVRIEPLSAVTGWQVCEVETDDTGLYSCDVALSTNPTFQARIHIGDWFTSAPINVDLSTAHLGQPVAVVQNLEVATALLQVSGVVRDSAGNPLPAAEVSWNSPSTLPSLVKTSTNASGQYTLTLNIDPSRTSISGTFNTSYGVAKASLPATFSDLEAGGNQRTQDIELRGSRLSFSGSVLNAFAPQLSLTGTLVITSTALGELCRTQVQNNSYSCIKDVDLTNEASLDLHYTLSGIWGSISSQLVSNATPATGMTQSFVRNFVVQPTTLQLRGRVRSANNTAVAGATVRIESDGAAVEGKTASDGSYQLWLALPLGTSMRSLQYRVTYRQNSVSDVIAATITPGQLNQIDHDLTYNLRQVTFRGTVMSSYGTAMSGSVVRISSPALPTECRTIVGSDGQFTCSAQLSVTAPFTATWTASGFWGQQSQVTSIDVTAGQDQVEAQASFMITPTALRVSGYATTPSGSPISNVRVSVVGTSVQQAAAATTNDAGFYDLLVYLNTPALPTTQTLILQAAVGQTLTTQSFAAQIRPNELVEQQRNVVISGMIFRFSGQISNALSNQPLKNTRVQISSPTLGQLCIADDLQTLQSSQYTCDVLVNGSQTFDVQYTLSGAWGSSSMSTSVTSLPAPGEIKEIRQNLSVNPTTLIFAGSVQDQDGSPLSGALVSIESPDLVQAVKVGSAGDGYRVYGVVRSGVTTATLRYRVSLGGSVVERQVSVPVGLNMLNHHAEDFQFTTGRKLTLSGSITNTTDPAITLGGTLLIFDALRNEEICRSSLDDGSYRCETINTVTGDRVLSYRLSGVWGQQEVPAELIPAGALTHTLNFAVAPALVYLHGTVKRPDGSVIPRARVSIQSYDAVPGSGVAHSVTADDHGVYSDTIVLGENVTSGQIAYRIESNGNTGSAQATFNLPQNSRTTTLEQDLTLATRTIVFSGQITNVVDAQLLPSSQIEITSPQLGLICRTSAGATYQCVLTTDTTDSFTVNYTLSGRWGSTSVQRTIDAAQLPAAGEKLTYTVNLSIRPTMLELHGRLLDHTGAPVNAAVSASGSGVVAQRLSLGDGLYTTTLVLEQINAPTDGQLTLKVFTPAEQQRMVSYTALPGQLTAISVADWTLPEPPQPRRLTLNINLRNLLVPNVPEAQPRGTYTVRSTTGQQWCSGATGSAPCTIDLYSAEPLDIVVEVSGDWGRQQRHLQISDLPDPGATRSIDVDFNINATTILLQGRVEQPGGAPLSNASVILSMEQDAARVGPRSVQLAADGTYAVYLLLPATFTSPRLNVQISKDGISKSYQVTGLVIQPNQLNQRMDSWLFELRRIRFSGSLTSALVPGMPVPGRLTITAPDLTSAWYCEISIQADGSYTCDAYVPNSAPFDVNYRFSGGWGQLDIPAHIDSIPSIGGTSFVEQSATVSPTTLLLVGHVTDPSGQPLSNTRITVANAATGAPGLFTTKTTTTDSSGHYTMTALLDNGQTNVNVRYTLTYYGVRYEQTRLFNGINQNQLNTLNQPFELNSRVLQMHGHVQHSALPQLNIPGQLVISDPSGAQLCATTVRSDGTYSCRAQGASIAAFDATYTLSGDWGSVSVQGAVESGVTGGTTDVSFDFSASPTVLHLHGFVKDESQNPVTDLELSVLASLVSVASPALLTHTNNQGEYDLYLVLQEGVTAGELTYRLRAGNSVGSVQVPFNVTSGALLDLPHDIEFSARTVRFQGTLGNLFAPALRLSNAKVTISSPTLGELCVLTTSAAGTFACELEVLNTTALPVHYDVVGSWGHLEVDGLIPAGATGDTTLVPVALLARATTLHVSGNVTDANNAPLGGAVVSVAGLHVAAATTATTTLSGTYELDVMIQAGFELETLTYTLKYGSQNLRFERVYEFASGQRTAVSADLSFAVRTFRFIGRLENTLAPSMTLGRQVLTIDAPGLGRLCSVTTFGGTYSCEAQLNVTQPFSFTYSLGGDWGQQTHSGSISSLPPVGGVQTLTRTLDFTPTLLIASGQLSTADGAALSGFTVGISNTQLSSLNAVLNTSTVSGAYTLPLILKRDQLSGSLKYTFTRDGLQVVETVPFTAQANTATPLIHNTTINARQLRFSGQVINHWAPETQVASTEVAIRAAQGQLCSWKLQSYTELPYSCSVSLDTTAAMSITYVITGAWGTAMISGTLPAGDFATYANVSQDLEVAPTTVFVTGVIADPEGNPVSGAKVTVTSPSFVYAGINPPSDTTGSDGVYGIFVPLRSGDTAPSIHIVAENGTLITDASITASVNADELNTVEQSLQYDVRRIVFSGRINNSLINQALGAHTIEISNPDLGRLCTWHPQWTLYASTYRCETLLGSQGELPITYTVIGDWGSAEFAGSIPAGSVSGSLGVSQDLNVTVTNVHLSGTVSDPLNNHLSGVQLAFKGADVSLGNTITRTTTAADGSYSIDLVVIGALNGDAISGNIAVELKASQATLTTTTSFDVPVNQLTPLAASYTFNARSVSFQGRILHQDLTWMDVPTKRVSVAVNGSELCSWEPTYYQSQIYACTGQLTSTDAVSATFTVSGDWGTQVLTKTIPAAQYATNTSLQPDLLVSPTTLRVRGQVQSSTGPLPSAASITVSGVDLLKPQTVNTQSGSYETFVLLKQGVASTTVTVTAQYQSAAMLLTQQVTPTLRQITSVTQNFTFDARRITFSGTAVSALKPDLTLGTRSMKVTASDGSLLCEAYVYSWDSPRAVQTCSATVYTTSAFSVTYTIKNDLGTQVFSGTVPVGAPGSDTSVSAQFPLTVTLLKLTGVITNGETNTPLAGATIWASSPAISEATSGHDATSASTGVYTLYLAIKPGYTSVNLASSLYYHSLTQQRQESVSVTPNAITARRWDATFSQRMLNLYGYVRLALNNTDLQPTQLSVSDAARGPLCAYNYSSSSSYYSCDAAITGTAPLNLTYVITGLWGTQTLTKPTIPVNVALGDTQYINQNLAVAPTTLSITGTVTYPDGTPISGAWIQATGPALAYGSTTSPPATGSNSSGRYALQVVLKPEALSGVLTYTIAVGQSTIVETRTYTAALNSITSQRQDFQFNGRRIQFYGGFVAPEANNAVGSASAVVVRDATLGELCRWQTSSTGTYYSCFANLRTSDPLSVTYTVSGPWGSEVITATSPITPPTIGLSYDQQATLAIHPAILRVHGAVTDDQGHGLANATVTASGSQQFAFGQWSLSTASDSNGAYTLSLPLRSSSLSGTLYTSVNFGVANAYNSFAYSASPHGITSVEKLYRLDQRKVAFNGTLSHATLSSVAVPVNQLAVKDGSQRTLCTYSRTYAQPSFGCTATLTATTPLSVTYVVTGSWGTTTLGPLALNSIPAVGGQTTLSQAFTTTAPTVALLTGTVRLANGDPAANARVIINSNLLASDQLGADPETGYTPPSVATYVYADEQGVYSTYELLRSGVTSGTLTYQVDYASASGPPFTAAVSGLQSDQLNTIEQDLGFNNRTVYFNGTIYNGTVADEQVEVQANAITITDELGTVLCSSSDTSSYWCAGTLTGTAALSVTYTFAGVWGVITETASIPAGAIGSADGFTHDITVYPTTLRVNGRITDANDEAVDWTDVEIYGDHTVGTISVDTDENGFYTAYVAVANPPVGELHVRTRGNSWFWKETTLAYDVPAGALTALTHDIKHDVRLLRIHSHFENTSISGESLGAEHVTIDVPGTSIHCTQSGAPNAWLTSVNCEGTTERTDALPVVFTISGDWGTHVYTDTFAAGVAGSSSDQMFNIQIAPRVIEISGTLRSASGDLLPNTLIQLSSAELSQTSSPYAWSDDAGNFTLRALLKADVTSGNLTYTVSVNGSSAQVTLPFSAGPELVSPVSHTVQLP